MIEFQKRMLKTAELAGIKILSDDYCCRLLAWLYAYGGDNEIILHNLKLRINIESAQDRLNIHGGATANANLYQLLRKYLMEVNGYWLDEKGYTHPEWVIQIFNEYGLKVPSLAWLVYQDATPEAIEEQI